MFHYLQRTFYVHGRRGGEARLGADELSPRRPVLPLQPGAAACTFDGPLAPDLLVSAGGRETLIASDLGRWTVAHAQTAARSVAGAGELRPDLRPARVGGLRVALVAWEDEVSPAVRADAAAAGVTLHPVESGLSPWAEVTRLLGTDDAAVIWVALPHALLLGSAASELRSMSDGDRVAVTFVVPGSHPRRHLFDSAVDSSDWLARSDPPAIIGIRADALRRMGGLRCELEAIGGIEAPAIELMRRALQQGEILGHGTASTVRWRPHGRRRPWRAAEWHRQRAHGALLATEPLPRGVIDVLQAAAAIAVLGASDRRRIRGRVTALGGLAHGVIAARGERGRNLPGR